MTKPLLVFDYDPVLYNACSVGEERSIKAIHRASGDEWEFATRTAFWGHHKKKAGGYLAEWNEAKSEEKRRKPEDFDIIDVQVPEPLSKCLHTIKQIITGIKETLDVRAYYGYSGKGEVFRVPLSTVLKYKGNRDDALRPLLLDDSKEYLIKQHSCRIVTGIEADDACSIDLYEGHEKWKKNKTDKNKLILAFVDKDYWGCQGFLYNTNQGGEVIENPGDLGRLWVEEKIDSKGKKVRSVKGIGMIWLYHQVMSGDDADNYCANSANPDFKWGEMASYELLKNCKTHKQAWEALVKGYKTLYPTPRKIIGWRGYADPGKRTILLPNAQDFEIEVDWKYMLQENFSLAKMLRWPDDNVDVMSVLKKLEVEH